VPVLPVARELFSKTKWIASKGAAHIDAQTPPKLLRAKGEVTGESLHPDSTQSHPNRRWRKKTMQDKETPQSNPTSTAESIIDNGNLSDDGRDSPPPKPRSRMFSILHQKSSSHSRTHTKMSFEGSADVRIPSLY
jgi:hypothetical protein